MPVASSFMIKLLDEGAIPPVGVGAKRRIEEAIKSLAMADLEAACTIW